MSTIRSVPDVQSADPLHGVSALSLPRPLLQELIEASDALAFQHLRDRKTAQGTEILCLTCCRAALGEGPIRHNSTCGVGRAIRATWAVRAAVVKAESEPEIPAAERELAARRLEQVTRRPDGDGHEWPTVPEAPFQLQRRVVCGAHWMFGTDPQTPRTCDKEVGHAADPRSDHWNRATGFSWPTVAAIAEEMKAAR